MEAAVFFKLVFRLPAYDGALAARLHAEDGPSDAQGSPGGRYGGGTYEAGTAAHNNAATAATAPPLTAESLAGFIRAQPGAVPAELMPQIVRAG